MSPNGIIFLSDVASSVAELAILPPSHLACYDSTVLPGGMKKLREEPMVMEQEKILSRTLHVLARTKLCQDLIRAAYR